MANPEHLANLKRGVKHWNEWRRPPNRNIEPDLRSANLGGEDLIDADLGGADLTRADLTGAKLGRAYFDRANFKGAHLNSANLFEANLNMADLTQAHLIDATLCGANLGGANLSGANLSRANLFEANLTGATLTGATLIGAKLTRANLRAANFDGAAHLDGAELDQATLTYTNLGGATLTGATLTGATLISTQLEGADLSGCNIYGVAAWNVNLKDAKQLNLRITPPDEPTIQVDNLEVAQFIYLLLTNEKVRNVIDTITSKVVLILGRFVPERKIVLEAIRKELRRLERVPVLFDFEKPASQSRDETISMLAHMARFVIADLTDAKSVLQELRSIVPNSPSVVVQPILLASQEEPGMFDFFRRFPWVLEPVRYIDQATLIAEIDGTVIARAEARAKALAAKPD